MHWTLAVLCLLCWACTALNIEQWATTRTVRTAGILVCLGWVVQQLHWAITGADSFALFVACDAAIIAWFLSRRRAFDMAEKLIAASIPATTALGAYAWLHDGHTTASWWANWSLVAAQMTLGLPRMVLQPILPLVSHGKLRRGA